MNITLHFKAEKETKGAVRYAEVDANGAPAFAPQIGTLYVRKSAMTAGAVPQMLTVVVTASK